MLSMWQRHHQPQRTVWGPRLHFLCLFIPRMVTQVLCWPHKESLLLYSEFSKPFNWSHCQLKAQEKQLSDLKLGVEVFRAELIKLSHTSTCPDPSEKQKLPNITSATNVDHQSTTPLYPEVIQSVPKSNPHYPTTEASSISLCMV